MRLFERLHKQLVLTPVGQEYVTAVQKDFYRIADATERLKPQGVATVLSVGVYARFDLGRLGPECFRAAHPAIGLRIMEPAALHELVEGRVDVLIDRGPGRPGYCCKRLEGGSAVGNYLICPEGTACCPEIESLRSWLNGARTVARFPRAAVRRSDEFAESTGQERFVPRHGARRSPLAILEQITLSGQTCTGTYSSVRPA